MKIAILYLCGLFISISAHAEYLLQQHQVDSLNRLLSRNPSDTVKFELYMQLGIGIEHVDPNRAVQEFYKAYNIAQQMEDQPRMMGCLITLGFLYNKIGQSPKAIEMFLKVLRYAEERNEDTSMAIAFIGISYEAMGDYKKGLEYDRLAYEVYEKLRKDNKVQLDPRGYIAGPLTLGKIYEKLNELDSALLYGQLSLSRFFEKSKEPQNALFYVEICNLLGKIYERKDQPKKAYKYFTEAMTKAREEDYPIYIQESQVGLASYFFKINKQDSVIIYASPAYAGAKKIQGFKVMREAAHLLRMVYEKKGEFDKALYYNDLAIAARDSVTGAEKVREVQILTNKEEIFQLKLQQEAEASRIALENKVKMYALLAILGSLALLATFLYINNRQKHKVNALLHEQKDEIASQKNKAEKALTELKSTQAQLIQSEKMASLGELTAGIAHEIQNPLNFVNNFSEVSEELMVEMVEEVDKGNYDDVKAIAKDVQQNLNKINHHGKRASNIVKGMLEHSRKSSGQKELTDLNTLAEEYLNIAYHGLKAKDPDFSAELITNFDPTLPKINVVSQDIGRVILNLITNAFYTVNERSKKGETGYEPKVTITTQLATNSQLLIAIKDNGSGIPDIIKDKIFQPFFTTKPTGQGTGLGLSLAYDIVKAHGGELKVGSTEKEGSEFMILLPL